MKTGWRHNDPQTQREFERFRKQSTVTVESGGASGTVVGSGGTTTIITNPPSSSFFELDAFSPFNTCVVSVENTGTKAFLRIDRFLTVAVDNLDILTRLEPAFTGGTRNTVKRINFISGDNVVLNGSNFADDEVTVTINANVTGGGGGSMSSWYVRTNTDAAEQISDNETVTFNNGETTFWSRAGNTLTVERPLTVKDDGVAIGDDNVTSINYDSVSNTGTQYIEWEIADVGAGERRVRGKYTPSAPSTYFWQVRSGNDGSGAANVVSSNIVTWFGTNGVYISRTGLQLNVDRPLQLQINAVNVGPSDTVVMDFRNATSTKPHNYTHQVYFEVTDQLAGNRRITAWSHAGGGGGGSYEWIASNGTLTATVTNGETVAWQGSNGVTVGLNTTTQTFTIDRPLQLQQEGTNVGNSSTITINWDNATVTKPAAYTSRVWTEIVDDGAGVRRLIAWYEPGSGGGSYYWNLQANGGPTEQIDNAETVNFTASGNLTVTRTGNTINYQSTPYSWFLVASATGGSEEITNTEQAIFTGRNGISVTRVNNQIFIERSTTDPGGGGGTSKRILTGEAIFSPTAPDYTGSQPAYRYGTRQFVDIVHNWNLSNLNNFHLQLVDRALDSTGTNVVYYRSGINPLWSIPPLGNQKFRNIPHWAAVDRNTIRVWATMSRLKPTEMRFRYTLVEL